LHRLRRTARCPARYSNWQRRRIQNPYSVGSNPTRATFRHSSSSQRKPPLTRCKTGQRRFCHVRLRAADGRPVRLSVDGNEPVPLLHLLAVADGPWVDLDDDLQVPRCVPMDPDALSGRCARFPFPTANLSQVTLNPRSLVELDLNPNLLTAYRQVSIKLSNDTNCRTVIYRMIFDEMSKPASMPRQYLCRHASRACLNPVALLARSSRRSHRPR
jgi:hypothetical protein